jgi:FG-GAP-like repeat
VNGDGKADLLVASCGPGYSCGGGINGVVGVLLGNGDGTFKSAVTYDAGGYGTASVAVADVNGDGKPDLVVANSYYSNTHWGFAG